jgi:GTP-binding protein
VGKSSLFNRLAGRRIAITDHRPGVTRDPVESVCEVRDRTLRIVDTGGVTTQEGEINRIVTRRSLERAAEADLILFMLEVGEVTGEDHEFMEQLRRYQDKTILVVNKVDNPDRMQQVWDFYQYGFEHVVGVSAAHGIGMTDLEETLTEVLAAASPESLGPDGRIADSEADAPGASGGGPTEAYAPGAPGGGPTEADAPGASGGGPTEADAPGGRPPEVAESDSVIRLSILGQPNTGKSTLLNRMVGSERAIVSEIAGTTRDVIEADFVHAGQRYVVVDTAGIRRRSRVEDDVEYYSVNRAIGAIEDCDVALLLVDAQKGLSDQDKKIAARIVDRGRGVLLVINKWDLFQDVPNMLQAFIDRTRYVFPVLSYAPVVAVSARDGTGIKRLMKTVRKAHQQLHRRVETGPLNRALAAWVEHSPPPAPKGRPYKPRYLTQVSTRPVKFVLFVNRAKGFPASYVQYIANRIRAEFGFDSVPVKVELRGKRE